MILICLCVAHVTAIMIICVGPTAVGNRADNCQFCKYGGRHVVGVSSCLPANCCVVCGSECPVLTQNGVWGSAALFDKQNMLLCVCF
jgi:hypothetical protein